MMRKQPIVNRRTRARTMWALAVLIAVAAFVYGSDAAMTWLRVTLHGR